MVISEKYSNFALLELKTKDLQMYKLFFELLQVAVGQLDCLSRGPSPEEWQELYNIARQQLLTGIGYRGVELLFEYGLRAPQDLSIDWMADAETIREGYSRLTKRGALVQKRLTEKGIRSSVLTGPGLAIRYDAGLDELRQPTRIDFYVGCDMKRAVKFVELTGQQRVHHNTVFARLERWEDTAIRLYCQPGMRMNPLKNKKLKQWLQRNADALYCEENGLVIPSLSMAIVCVLLNFRRNLLHGCATMSELMDCYFLLRRAGGNFGLFKDGVTIETTMKQFGFLPLAQGVMWLLQEALSLDRSLMPCEPDEAEGHFVMSQVMKGRQLWPMLRKYPFGLLWSIV